MTTFKKYLTEVLDEKFKTVEWEKFSSTKDGDGEFGYATIHDIKIRMIIHHLVKDNIVNLTFGVWDDKLQKFSANIGTIKTEHVISMMGAITNALIDRIQEHKYEYLIIGAKDAVEKRMSLYKRIAKKIQSKFNFELYEPNNPISGIKNIIVLTKHKNLTEDELFDILHNALKKSIKT
jgi:hypothetical protein